MDPMELGAGILRFMYTKVTQISYGYFVKFSYFGFWRKWFLHLCQKLQSLIKKHKEFYGLIKAWPKLRIIMF
jgi:hypothetical protein